MLRGPLRYWRPSPWICLQPAVRLGARAPCLGGNGSRGGTHVIFKTPSSSLLRVFNTRSYTPPLHALEGIAGELPGNSNQVCASDPCYGGKQVICVDGPLYDYILAHTREPEVLVKLREETSKMSGSQMQTSPEQGQFLAMLVHLIGAERCIEVGVYTGYSSLAVALALPDCGCLVACERDEASLDVARRYYKQAGISHKVHIHQGMALDALKKLLDDGEANSYDFAFLDADKRKYMEYYELLLQLIRPGGLVVIDNVLWHGKVTSEKAAHDKKTQSLKDLNSFILHDERVDISMVPIGDGMTLCRKRKQQES